MVYHEKMIRKPEWLRIRLKTNKSFADIKKLTRDKGLHTVCEEARCPNIHECWSEHRTASFMILGDTCTRRCRFCAVKTGLPTEIDWMEPRRVAESVLQMDLDHVHITMVNRDDLADGGAAVLAETVRAIRKLAPHCTVELLCSDLMGDYGSIKTVVESRPDIMSHNVETVRRLTARIRSRSDYDRSLHFLRVAKAIDPQGVTKSSIMLGLGETVAEVHEVMDDLRACGVDMINIGQYLQPTRNNVRVRKYWHPAEFSKLKRLALAKGFIHCESGPLVRSSYHAGDQLKAFKDRVSLMALHRKQQALSGKEAGEGRPNFQVSQ